MVSPLQTPEGVDTVLLDIGNVLASDYWETLLLTPDLGLADLLHLDREHVNAVGVRLWQDFCRAPTHEHAYWARLAEELEVPITDEHLSQIEHLPRANPRAPEILADLAQRGARIGLISDNTSFWFTKQRALIGFGELLDAEVVLLSFEHGVSKSDSPGLFELAAGLVDPRRTLVVDDRTGNLSIAGRLGFHTFRYSMQDDEAVKSSTAPAT